MDRSMTSGIVRAGGVWLVLSAVVLPAQAQDAGQEIREMRELLRRQNAAMLVLQRRLAALEAKQGSVAAKGAAPPAAPGNQRVAGGPPATAAAPGDAGRTELQPTQAGTVEAAPRQQAGVAPSSSPVSPAQGNPPLPVLSGNDRVQVTVSGQVNRSVIFHGDGGNRVDTYFADNNVSSTRLRVLGSARLDKETVAVSAIEFDLRSNSSASITRQSVNNNGGDTPTLGPLRIRRAEVGVQSAYGSVLLGRGSTFTDGIAEFDLSGTDVAIYSALQDTAGSLQFANRRAPYRRATDATISQVFDDFDGPRDDRIRYDSPAWNGLSVGGSVGQGLFADVGARYAAEVSGAKIAAGVGFMNYTGMLPSSRLTDGTNTATTPFSRRVAGSAALLLPNGLNALVSAGWGQHTSLCCGAGLVARSDATTYFLKAGYQARIFEFGTTNFAVEGGQTRNRIQDGDVASRVGFSINQPIIAKGFEVYLGYEHLLLARRGVRPAPSDLGLVGSRIQF